MTPEYCNHCKRNITPKGMHPGWLIAISILLLIWIPLLGFFIMLGTILLLIKGRRCPICNGKDFATGKILKKKKDSWKFLN